MACELVSSVTEDGVRTSVYNCGSCECCSMRCEDLPSNPYATISGDYASFPLSDEMHGEAMIEGSYMWNEGYTSAQVTDLNMLGAGLAVAAALVCDPEENKARLYVLVTGGPNTILTYKSDFVSLGSAPVDITATVYKDYKFPPYNDSAWPEELTVEITE